MKKLAIDVFNINGSLYKTDKFWRIRLFCNDCHSRRSNLHALIMTNALNVGINKHSISLQVQFEWPHDLLSYFKERGQGSRTKGAASCCVLFADLASYIYLMSQLHISSSSDEETAVGSDNLESFNSAISPGRQSRLPLESDRHQYALGQCWD